MTVMRNWRERISPRSHPRNQPPIPVVPGRDSASRRPRGDPVSEIEPHTRRSIFSIFRGKHFVSCFSHHRDINDHEVL